MIYRANYFRAKEHVTYLSEVMQLNPNSVGRYWSCLKHLLTWADAVPFSQVAEIRPTFSSYLASMAKGEAESATLGGMTAKKILQTAKRFFKWLKTTYPLDYRHLPAAWIDGLRLPRSTQPVEEHRFVTLDQVLQLIHVPIAHDDVALWRDQAAAAMLFLSGARASAFTSLTLECVDLDDRMIKQWTALGVKTKNSKSATTYLLEIPELLQFVARWDVYLRSHLPSSTTWYVPIIQHWGERELSAKMPGMNRNIALAQRLHKLYALAEMPYHSPLAFRHGHAVLALQHCLTMADYKAVSMNLMHESITVTDGIYAPLATSEVKHRVSALTGSAARPGIVLGENPSFAQAMTDDQLADALTVAAKRLSR